MPNYIRDIMYVAEGIPATEDAAGFEALSWTKVNGIQVLPKFGLTHNVIEVEDLESGFTKGEKGAGSGAETEITYWSGGSLAGDAGQELLRTLADDSEGTCSVKIVRKPTGPGNTPASGDDVEYALGFAHSYTPTDNNVSTHVGASVTFRQNARPVYATEPV